MLKKPLFCFIKHFLLAGAFCFSYSLAQASDVVSSQEKSTVVMETQDKTTINPTAQAWGLSEAHWQRYLQFMKGAEALWYAHLSPLAILGMRADTPEEQQYFAQLFAKQEHDKVARELAFNQAVSRAMRQLYPDELMIKDFDKTPFNPGNMKSIPVSLPQNK